MARLFVGVVLVILSAFAIGWLLDSVAGDGLLGSRWLSIAVLGSIVGLAYWLSRMRRTRTFGMSLFALFVNAGAWGR